jgi:hypothetical protein
MDDERDELRQERADLLAKRAKTVEEKRHELYKANMAVDNKSIIEKLAEQAIAAGPEVNSEVNIFDLLKGDKDDVEKNVTSVIKDQIAKLGDNVAENEQKAKFEENLKKQYFTEITKFDKFNFAKEYKKTL